MAAGKLGGYRGNEFRDRELEIGGSRKEYYYSKDEFHHRYHSREREVERRKEGGGRDGYKGSRRREERDELYRSSVSSRRSGSRDDSSGGRKGRYEDKLADREPGEISSGSGSDGSIASVQGGSDREVSVLEIEIELPARKKQKYSPVVWDGEEKKVNGKLTNQVAFPPVVRCTNQSRKGASISTSEIFAVHDDFNKLREQSPVSVGPNSVASPLGLTSTPKDWRESDYLEAQQHEDEVFLTGRKISASRWADEDEGEIPDDKDMQQTGTHMPTCGSSGTSSISKLPSPEFEECTSGKDHGSESNLELYNDNDAEGNDDIHNKVDVFDSDADMDGEDDYLKTPESTSSPQRNTINCCRSVHDFERIRKIGSGTYGVVFQARDKKTGEIVALKKVKMEKEREGFPITSLREINILVSLRHPSVVEVKEVVVEEDVKRGKFETYLVMEYIEHDLKGLMDTMKNSFSQSEVKCLMLQLLEAVEYLHDNWVLHRDLKTSNILFSNSGELKICDFGLSRQYGSPLKPYTPLVVSLWYRAPELLLGAGKYSTAIDMWSLGCIMAELLTKEPLFKGESEINQVNKIFEILGTPNETTWPGFSTLPGAKPKFVRQKSSLRKKFPPTSFTGSAFLSSAGLDLLERLLTYDPDKRITAQEAVRHEWFREVPLPKSKEFMPTFPPEHKARQLRRIRRTPD
ncbi:cyclin-dependent kinase [Ranunculus cassubicifolius]